MHIQDICQSACDVSYPPRSVICHATHLGVGESCALSAKHDAYGGPSRPWDVLKEVAAENVFLVHKPEKKKEKVRSKSLISCLR